MENSLEKYDAIIIGSGQGGNPLAQKLATNGQRVALVEKRDLGGTCINTGCTPTKAMVASSTVAHNASNASQWGNSVSDVRSDLRAIVERKNKIVEEYRSGWQTKFDKQKTLHLYRGTARFSGARTIEVNGQTLGSDHIFIDTGSRSTTPSIPGLDSVPFLTNESLLELTTLPVHLLIVGGGYIGLEFSQMFRRFGCKVTVIQHNSHVLPREDSEISDALQQALEAEGIGFLLNTQVTGASGSGTSLSLTLKSHDGEKTLSGSHLLIAAGRQPNTADLKLSAAGVATDERGYIQVNDQLQTSAEGIWAIGDVTGGPAFTHISYNDFQIIYGNLYEGKRLSTKDRIVPYAVFTDPQLGRVGLTEKEARLSGHKLKIGSVPMKSVSRAVERGETAGLMKIVVDAESDQVLGAAILAVEGGEVVQILHTLMLARQPYTLLKGAVYIHPTIAEGFFSLLESVKPVD